MAARPLRPQWQNGSPPESWPHSPTGSLPPSDLDDSQTSAKSPQERSHGVRLAESQFRPPARISCRRSESGPGEQFQSLPTSLLPDSELSTFSRENRKTTRTRQNWPASPHLSCS